MTRKAIAGMFFLMLAGCRVVVTVPEGGHVHSLWKDHWMGMNCQAGETCQIDVIDSTFHHRFIAVPDDGWDFVGWKDDLLCGGSREDCVVTTQGWDYSNPDIRAIFSDPNLVYQLTPEFRKKDPQNLYPDVAGQYYQETEGYWLTCELLGTEWQVYDYSTVTLTQEGNQVKLTVDTPPDPDVQYSQRWDRVISMDERGRFEEEYEEAYVLKTGRGKVKVTESWGVSGRFSEDGYEGTLVGFSQLTPRFGPYKGDTLRCATGAVDFSGERI